MRARKPYFAGSIPTAPLYWFLSQSLRYSGQPISTVSFGSSGATSPSTVAILAQGTSWVVAATQAFLFFNTLGRHHTAMNESAGSAPGRNAWHAEIRTRWKTLLVTCGSFTGRGEHLLRPCRSHVQRAEQPSISQRSLHNTPIVRLLLQVAVHGAHQCDFLNC